VTGVTQTVRYFASSLWLAVFLARTPAHGVSDATATVFRDLGAVMGVALAFTKGGRVTEDAAAGIAPSGA
jgi:hypothetical protein